MCKKKKLKVKEEKVKIKELNVLKKLKILKI